MTGPFDNIAICGYPRSGSTLLYNLIRATCVSHRTFDREVSAIGLREPAPWITKDPTDRRHPWLPAHRIITIRDPRDVLCSVHSSQPDDFKVGWDYSLTGKQNALRLRSEGMLEIDAQCWHLEGLVVSYEELCTNPDAIQQRISEAYGVVFSAPFAGARLDPPPGLTKQLNGVRPPEQSRIGVWRRYPERIRQQFEECPELHDVLQRRGYEEDREWLERL